MCIWLEQPLGVSKLAQFNAVCNRRHPKRYNRRTPGLKLAGFVDDFQSIDVGVQVLDGHQRYSQLTEGVRLQTVE